MKNRINRYFSVILLFISLISFIGGSKLSKNEFHGSFNLILNPFTKIFDSYNTIFYSRFENEIKYSNNKIELIDLVNNRKQDSIKTGKDSLQTKSTETKRTFFGKVFSYGLPPAPGLGPCEVGVFKTYYVFGIKLYGPTPVTIPLKKNEQILIQEVVPCGTEYVPEKDEKKSKKDKSDKKNKSEKTETTETQEELESAKPKRKMDEQFFK